MKAVSTQHFEESRTPAEARTSKSDRENPGGRLDCLLGGTDLGLEIVT